VPEIGSQLTGRYMKSIKGSTIIKQISVLAQYPVDTVSPISIDQTDMGSLIVRSLWTDSGP